VTTWSIAKWPVLIILVSLTFAILYWASPNAETGGFRWVSPGGVFAVVLWILASAGFAVHLADFASYNKTYGTLGGAIAFLVWMWISNIAILLGAELDAEMERGRAVAAGGNRRGPTKSAGAPGGRYCRAVQQLGRDLQDPMDRRLLVA
jgi:membrane protein